MSLTFTLLRLKRRFMFALIPILAGACGEDFVDADFGGVDLAPFFFDSGLTIQQGGGPPATMRTQQGYLDGTRFMQFYDFGWSASSKDLADPETRNRLGLGERDRIPKLAPVNPMYFFFDARGNPMTSEPQYEQKTGYYFMVGGKGLRAINPTSDAKRNIAYPLRERAMLTDRNRNVADYQRPIIDVVFDRDRPELLQRYSGLWEVVKVTAPAGYTPDDIKGWDTLERAWNRGDGDFKIQPTGTAINCPIVDSRTLMIPSVAAFERGQLREPQPRIELWYRQKRVFCFLANGWPTLGKTEEGANGVDKYTLHKFNEDAGFSVFDTDVFRQGKAGTKAERRDIVAPLGYLYVPTVTTLGGPGDEAQFIPDHTVATGALPKRNKGDLAGYRPVRWLWNIQVTENGRAFGDGRYFLEPQMDDIRNIDSSRLSPREGVHIRNIPLVAGRVYCKGATPEADPCATLGQICGTLQGENAEYCVVKQVRYGEFCAPTVAECRATAESPKDNLESWFVTGAKLTEENAAVVPENWQAADPKPNRPIVERWRRTYSCLRDTVSRLGHCYLTCNGNSANTLQGSVFPPLDQEAIKIKTRSGRELSQRFALDSRCGGALMPGFRCLPVTDAPTDRGGSLCMRDCQTAEGEDVTDAVCQYATPTYFSDTSIGLDVAANTKCLTTNIEGAPSFTACRLNEAFAPF